MVMGKGFGAMTPAERHSVMAKAHALLALSEELRGTFTCEHHPAHERDPGVSQCRECGCKERFEETPS